MRQGEGRGLDILERRHWAVILFLVGPSIALQLKEKRPKQDGGGHGFAPAIPLLKCIQVSK